MISSLFKTKKHIFSLEVFPPKKEEEFQDAYKVLSGLSKLSPDFISVTYGAGGSRSKKTIEIASYIQNQLKIPALAHLTCIGNQKADIENVTTALNKEGINNILALRGDRPSYMDDDQFNSREFFYASDLIRFLKKNTSFDVTAACYPEKHFESSSMDEDLNYLKQKQDLGCSFFISQLFFDNHSFYRFLDLATAKNITIPICAGIMPITSVKQLGTTVSLSGSSIPKTLSDLIVKYQDQPEEMRKAGIDFAICQIMDLREQAVSGIHLYSMNKLKTTTEIISALSL